MRTLRFKAPEKIPRLVAGLGGEGIRIIRIESRVSEVWKDGCVFEWAGIQLRHIIEKGGLEWTAGPWRGEGPGWLRGWMDSRVETATVSALGEGALVDPGMG